MRSSREINIYFSRIEIFPPPRTDLIRTTIELDDSQVTEQIIQVLMLEHIFDSSQTNTFVFRVFPRYTLPFRWLTFFTPSSDWLDVWLIEDYEKCILSPPLKAGQKLTVAYTNIPRMDNDWTIEAIESAWLAEFQRAFPEVAEKTNFLARYYGRRDRWGRPFNSSASHDYPNDVYGWMEIPPLTDTAIIELNHRFRVISRSEPDQNQSRKDVPALGPGQSHLISDRIEGRQFMKEERKKMEGITLQDPRVGRTKHHQ